MDCFASGFLALIILCVIAYRVVNGLSAIDFEEDEPIGPLTLAKPVEKHDAGPERLGFAAVRHADPHFDLDRFYARVAEMFVAYHAAADRGDLKPARRFIDERYYADLLAESPPRISSAEVARPAPAGPLTVEHTRAMTATHEAGMDEVRVLITARRSDGGDTLQEYWTLIRRQGAITKADLSLYRCPNCGAPTDGDDPTRCGYCGARLADPALDWVVSQIRGD